MALLRVARAVFVLGLPLAVILHLATSRAELPWLRAAGMIVIVAWLLFYLWLAYARCPSCGQPFFGSFLGQVWGPYRAFRLRPGCSGCGVALRGRPLY